MPLCAHHFLCDLFRFFTTYDVRVPRSPVLASYGDGLWIFSKPGMSDFLMGVRDRSLQDEQYQKFVRYAIAKLAFPVHSVLICTCGSETPAPHLRRAGDGQISQEMMMGPKMEQALLCIFELEGQAEAYVGSHIEESDFEAGFINRTIAARLANQDYLMPLVSGQPLRLTNKGREYVLSNKILGCVT